VLGAGRLLALGAPAAVLTPATLREAFGVDAELDCAGPLPSLRVYGAARALTSSTSRPTPRASAR
jgi:hypothetical protein